MGSKRKNRRRRPPTPRGRFPFRPNHSKGISIHVVRGRDCQSVFRVNPLKEKPRRKARIGGGGN